MSSPKLDVLAALIFIELWVVDEVVEIADETVAKT